MIRQSDGTFRPTVVPTSAARSQVSFTINNQASNFIPLEKKQAKSASRDA